MPDIEKIEAKLNRAIELIIESKKDIQEAKENVEKQLQLQMQNVPEQKENKEVNVNKKLVEQEQWPEAINCNIICNPDSEQERKDRGRGIVELMIEENLKGLKFLDYGCGCGSCVLAADELGAMTSIGYDVEKGKDWNDKNFTMAFEEVQQNGPYDVVLFYDVLDHLVGEEPVEALKKIHSVLKPDGKVYMRCHPWTSRHATHMYSNPETNKAYLHLVFNEQEIKEMFPEAEIIPNIGINRPIIQYAGIIEESGFVQESRRETSDQVENFFKIPAISERIIANSNTDGKFPEFQMSLQFIDYCLRKKG